MNGREKQGKPLFLFLFLCLVITSGGEARRCLSGENRGDTSLFYKLLFVICFCQDEAKNLIHSIFQQCRKTETKTISSDQNYGQYTSLSRCV